MDFDVKKFLYKKNYIYIGNICNYNWSYQKKKFSNHSKELTYCSDGIFIKNIFKENLDIDIKKIKIIISFLVLFNYFDLALYVSIINSKNLIKKEMMSLKKTIINLKSIQSNYYEEEVAKIKNTRNFKDKFFFNEEYFERKFNFN